MLQLHYASVVSGVSVSRWYHVRKHLRVHGDLQPVAVRAGLYSWHCVLNQPRCLQAERRPTQTCLGCWFHWKAGWRCRLMPRRKRNISGGLKKQVSSHRIKTSCTASLNLEMLPWANGFELIFPVIIQLWENPVFVSLQATCCVC